MTRIERRRRTQPNGGRAAASRSAEQRCDDYRRAFLSLLHEPFENLDATLARMLEALATTLNVDRVSLWVFDRDFEVIRCEHQYVREPHGTSGPMLLNSADYPAYFRAVAQQLVIAANDARNDPRTSELTRTYLAPLDIHAMLDVPVRAFGRYVGVLCHEQIGATRVWTAEDENFASGVATQIALAFERDHAKRAQAELLRRSMLDEESQLANRLRLDESLDTYLKVATRKGALVVTCVDQYKYVAASLGTQRMQHLVRQFALRLLAAAPEGALVARLAPNEFAMLLRNVAVDQVPLLIDDWVASVQLPLKSEEQKLFFTLSTGYTLIEPDRDSLPEHLRSEAQLAAQEARDAGGNRVKPFTRQMRELVKKRVVLEQDLRRGLAAAEFNLHFQPVIDLKTRRCASVEALLRWRHPERGIVPPEEFLAVAVDAGIMLELGRRVLRAACDGLARLRERTGIPGLRMAINMSAPELLLPGTAEAVQHELMGAGLRADALTIEVTETCFAMDLVRASAALEEIRSLGVRIGLDDFGTAYSSLSWLRRLPIDEVKIDRSYVAGIENDPRDLTIVKTIVSLAREFGRTVTAEGVETPGQLRMLDALGVDSAQGFLFAHPEPLEKFSASMLAQLVSGPAVAT
jgi:diguanylate cyclase